MGSKKIPEVRFKEFSGEWEERKLGEVADVYDGTHQTPKYKKEGIMFLSVENIKSLKSSKYISEEAFNKEFKIRPEKNDLLMTRIGDIGTANVVDEDVPIAYYVSLALIKSQVLNPYFLQANIHAPTTQKELWRKTLHIAFPKKINKNEISKIRILSTSFEEQMKIGCFFKKLNEIIALKERELDTLKQTKQGFLQKMFPKEGELVPEIRLPGFRGEWEERNFFDNINSIIDFRGRTPKKLGLDWSKSGYLALSALNVKNGYIDLNVDAYYGDEELYNKWMGDKKLKQGQVLFTTEAPMGNVAQVPDNKGYILSQRTIAFDVDDTKITNDFLSILLRSPIVINELYSMSSGGTAKGVSQKSLSKLKIVVPKSLEEQIQFGNFFKQLHRTIALHEQELNVLKQTKKAFLQKMFV